MKKTHYQLLMETKLGVPIEEFILEYKLKGENRYSVSRRTGIPVPTLRQWEKQILEETTTYRIREEVTA